MTDEQRKKANAEKRRQEKARQEINAIHNIVTPKPTVVTKKESAKKERIRKSENAKWKQKRYERYQGRVWPGWRTSAPAGKIVKYNINDVSQNKDSE